LAILESSDSIVLPGVGSFRDAMGKLNGLGLVRPLSELVIERKKRFLGVCLGMQLLADWGYEDGETPGLGWVKGEVKRIPSNGVRIPHMGWNDITPSAEGRRALSLLSDNNFYFMHSYYFKVEETGCVTSTTDYGIPLTASLRKNNITAAQFHPEK